MLEGTDVEFSTDRGETWASLGTLTGPFVGGPEDVDVTPVEVEQVFAPGSFSFSGTLTIEDLLRGRPV